MQTRVPPAKRYGQFRMSTENVDGDDLAIREDGKRYPGKKMTLPVQGQPSW